MKAVTEVCVSRPAAYGIKTDSSCKIMKPKVEDTAEMQACFLKLKELVPTIPHGRKISKVQLLQHVIDYILDLEIVLDVPSSRIAPVSPSCRTPLSENTDLNTLLSELTSNCEEQMDDDLRPPSK